MEARKENGDKECQRNSFSAFFESVFSAALAALEANGVYKATEQAYCDAPVYKHAKLPELKITREPHKNPKTGAVKHGWLLGKNSQPLYGAKTESLEIPASGWRQFGGEEPIPAVKVLLDADELHLTTADEALKLGAEALERQEWQAAVGHFTAGIDTLKQTKDLLNEGFKSRAAMLLSQRGTAHLRLKEPKAALRDAVAALEMKGEAEALALEALKELGVKESEKRPRRSWKLAVARS
ncbi:unnamed protein product [Effrenium voratum]|nr:unnamed protein product [Effrenium voratum]